MNVISDLRMEVLPEAAKRLQSRRQELGYHSARAFAVAHGINVSTYQHHENGRRTLTVEQLKRYAGLLGIHTNALLSGAPIAANTTHLVGTVSGEGVVSISDPDSDIELVVVPDFSLFTALKVVGDDLYPAYRDGDVVFHRGLTPLKGRETRLHTRDCVVDLPSGERVLRQVVVQASGKCALIGYKVPPLLEVDVLALAPIEFVRRAP